MIKFIFTTLLLCFSLAVSAQINIPAMSPSVTITQKIGLTTATLTYSRPSLRGRDLFGEAGILEFGKKWRTGANATTKVEFSGDIEINGLQLPKGAYVLLSTPNEKTWTFHFYPFEAIPYTSFLERDSEFEFTVQNEKLNYSLETFSLHFEAISLSSSNLVMQWGNYKASLPIKLNEHASILANIERELNGPSGFDYFQAALYLHETQTDLPLALKYVRKATQDDNALFFQVYREALILKDLNKKTESIIAAKRSKQLSIKAGNEDFVGLSQQIIDELSR